MRIASVACSNGLGHVKRQVAILNELLRFPGMDAEVTLFCGEWQERALRDWGEYRALRQRKGTVVSPVDLPLRWSPRESHYGPWMDGWDHAVESLDLPSFDRVVSDNYVEPLRYAEGVTLCGSFLWHDVLAAAYPDHPPVRRYAERSRGILAAARPPMMVNRYFAMPAVLRETRPCETGLIPLQVSPDRKRAPPPLPRNAVIAPGKADPGAAAIREITEAASVLAGHGVTIHADDGLKRVLGDTLPAVQNIAFERSDLAEMDLAIIRGGLGSISDCIAAGIPMAFLHDTNPEILHNQRRIAELGIGIPVELLSDRNRSPLVNPSVYREMGERCRDFDLHGAREAAEILIRLWRDR